MDRWIGKIAVVTGASSGIGAAICIDLVKAGIIVIGLARRVDKIDELKQQLSNAKGKLYSYHCDIQSIDSIKAAFAWIEKEFGGVNILVNNAGITRCNQILSDTSEQDILDIVNTNLIGTIFCTKETFKILRKNDAEGHIINMNSIFGHGVPMIASVPVSNIYSATKHGITAASEILRQELLHLNYTKIKVTSISPGLVKTGIVEAANYPKDNRIFETCPTLNADDISEAVLYALGTKPHVQVKEIIIKPMGERC